MKGGKAIASGGYGCVFYPALRCLDEERTNGISKLLKRSNAREEYEEAERILPVLKNIPDYRNFVLLPDELCYPDDLTPSDKENVDKKCAAFGEITTNVSKYQILNMPFGGPDVDKYIQLNKMGDNFVLLNQSLMNLLKSAIKVYNENRLIHADLKGANVLVNEKTLQCKIIDWGLAVKYSKENTVIIDEELEWRPIQFNIPPSNILMSEYFVSLLSSHVKASPVTKDSLAKLIKDHLPKFREKYGDGHIDYMEFMMSILIKNLNLNVSPIDMICNYIANCAFYCVNEKNRVTMSNTGESIQMSHKKKRKYKHYKYFYDIYSHNCDIWGLLTIYVKMLELSRTQFDLQDVNTNVGKFRISLSKILFKYMINHSVKKIPINDLSKELLSLNDIFKSTTISSMNSNIKSQKLRTKLSVSPEMESNIPDEDTLSERLASIRHHTRNDARQSSITKSRKKRCPKGTRRNKRTGQCENISMTKKNRKRCPNGTRRNKKTGECEQQYQYRG